MIIKHKADVSQVRSEAYPSIEEQMDMLWHSMNKGEIPKAEPFYSRIKEVKDTYPKSE